MSDQIERAKTFHSLHVPGRPLILYNAWDAGSAKAVAAAGAKAIATGSASVAAAHGMQDGESVPLDLVLANASRIVASTDLPVTLDFERGYGADPRAMGESIAAALQTGITGCNIEDSIGEGGAPLRETAEQAERIAAARAAADRTGIPMFINARTDIFFQEPAERHDSAMVEAALDRARAYADAGANGLFVPMLTDDALIGRLTAESPLPVNIMALGSAPPIGRLAELGVARVSYGPGPYRLAMKALEEAARQVHQLAAIPA